MAKKEEKKTAVTDPLEASKIMDKPKPEAKPEPKEEAPAVAAAPEAAPAAPGAPVKKYMVATTTTISLEGQFTTLHKGDVVSAESYGPTGMQRILDSNVALVELKE